MTDLSNTPYVPSADVNAQKLSINSLWAKPLFALLKKVKFGVFQITLPHGEVMEFRGSERLDVKADIVLKNYKPIADFFLHGELAFAECFIAGEWGSTDLTTLFKFALLNENIIAPEKKGNFFSKAMTRFRHLLNSNSKSGSRKNISFHYDLGNDFYSKWLDETMTYSSALFDQNYEENLVDAQLRKYRKIADMAEIQSGESVLEIGCGWGGFSEIATVEYGCKVEGVTLSTEQFDYAQERYANKCISSTASASLTDYRDTDGQYDRIVSIEMFEAVGYEYWPTYFQTITDRLKPNGTALLQVILIEDKRFESYRKNVDFIQKYIFPGGLLPSQKVLSETVSANGLELEEEFLFGKSYAKTCQIWKNDFLESWPDLKVLGFDEKFKRMWLYYLSYCEAGFEKGSIDVGLFKIRKPA